jgi:hypothetical protein
MTKSTADTAIVGRPERALDRAIVRSFIQSWLAPALARKLTEQARRGNGSLAHIEGEALDMGITS